MLEFQDKYSMVLFNLQVFHLDEIHTKEAIS